MNFIFTINKVNDKIFKNLISEGTKFYTGVPLRQKTGKTWVLSVGSPYYLYFSIKPQIGKVPTFISEICIYAAV
jgi:hypothetical protein